MPGFFKILLVAVLIGGGWFYKEHRQQQERSFSSPAAASLKMLQGALPGDGKPVVLEFWGTYCGPCIRSIPHFTQLHGKFGRQAQFLAVSSESAGTVGAFLKLTPLSYPVAVDQGHGVFKAWGIKGVPTLIVLNASHREIWRGHTMQLSAEKLAELLGKS